jgi:PBP1b-binding outer membrane lipoprotein LpoB
MHPPEIAAMARIVLPACLALLLAACSDPGAPDKEQPPEPQASAAADGDGLPRGPRAPLSNDASA